MISNAPRGTGMQLFISFGAVLLEHYGMVPFGFGIAFALLMEYRFSELRKRYSHGSNTIACITTLVERVVVRAHGKILSCLHQAIAVEEPRVHPPGVTTCAFMQIVVGLLQRVVGEEGLDVIAACVARISTVFASSRVTMVCSWDIYLDIQLTP